LEYLTDSHCHLFLPDFTADRESVLAGAADQHVQRILVPGINVESSRIASTLYGNKQVKLFAAAGIHPNCDQILHEDMAILRKLIESYPICAIGEIGLDYYRMKNTSSDQIKVFRQLLDLALEYHLPVCLHNRDADADMIQILDEWISKSDKNSNVLAKKRGVFHSFGGSEKIADWAIQNHFYLGISGVITYKKASCLRQIVADVDLKHLLIETDAPFLAPQPLRGKRNEPKFVKYIAEEIANLKSIPFSEVARITSENANILFRWYER